MTFRPRLWPTLFSALGLLLLIFLGTWQLVRYQSALDFEQRRNATLEMPVVDNADPQELAAGDLDFRNVSIRGHWDRSRTFLAKHRVNNGRPGFWVINGLVVDGSDEATLFVNRGWIPQEDGPERALTLQQELPQGPQAVSGLVHPLDYVVVDDAAHERLDEQSEVTDIFALETYDLSAMTRAVEGDVVSDKRILTIAEAPRDQTYPQPTTDHVMDRYLTSETHFGYMLTWYLLALALIAIWLAGSMGYLGSRAYEGPPAEDR